MAILDWLGSVDVGSAVVTVVVGVLVIWVIVRRIWPGIRAIVQLAALLEGLPDFMKRTDDRMTAVDHELHPNHGSSMKDSLERLERRLAEVSDRQARILVEQNALRGQVGDVASGQETIIDQTKEDKTK